MSLYSYHLHFVFPMGGLEMKVLLYNCFTFSCTCSKGSFNLVIILFYRQYRLMAYRMFIRYIHVGQVLGRHVRRPIPSCCTEYIHRIFPDPNGVYVGFKYFVKNE